MICNDLDCFCSITSTTLMVTGSGSAGDPYAINSNAFAICTSSTRPASPFLGLHIYETDTDRVFNYDGVSWVWQSGNTPRFHLEQQAAQSIGSGADTVPTMSVEVVDTDGFHSGTAGTATIPATWGGDWLVSVAASWLNNTLSYRRSAIAVGNNGGMPTQNTTMSGGYQMEGTLNNGVPLTTMVRLRAAATVSLQVHHAVGSALDLNSCALKGHLVTHIPTLV